MTQQKQCNFPITLFSSDVVQRKKNAKYPHEIVVTSEEDFKTAVEHDYVCAKYIDNHRSNENFIWADCLPLDFDNDIDDESKWVTPQDVIQLFPDVCAYVQYSRHHMKEKEGKSPRPRFHVVFPISECISAEEYVRLKETCLLFAPMADEGSMDAARFMYGTPDAKVEYFPGIIDLSTFFDFEGVLPSETGEQNSEEESSPTSMEKAGGEIGEPIYEGHRNNTLHGYALNVLTRHGDTDESHTLYLQRTKDCDPLLEDSEVKSIWENAKKYYHNDIEKSPGYISPDEFEAQNQRSFEDDFSDLDGLIDINPAMAEDIFSFFNFYSVPDLTEEERKAPEFIIQGMIPCGLSFLSGAPKIRKSFLALQMATAVATGTPFFGHPVTQCSVVYLDLEGSKSRIFSRTERMTIEIPRNVLITNEVTEKLSNGLIDKLKALHIARPEIRFIIIDTYSHARGTPKSFGQNAYDADVAFLEPLQRMAIEEKIAILCVHHDKKGAGFVSDSFERISGTMGISGSCDSVLNLIATGKRSDGKATLEFVPRDAKGGELSLEFIESLTEWWVCKDPVNDILENPVCKWILSNPPAPKTTGDFISYKDLYHNAYGTYSDRAWEKVKEQLAPYIEDLFKTHHIGIQQGVKNHGERGIRLVSLL